jgi:membrane protein YdbS with pleckstrin-like domain
VRILFSVVLLIIGCTLPLLLNGQPFSDSMIGIFCAVASATLAFTARQDEPNWVWNSVAAAATVLCVVLLSLIPSALRTQQQFNAPRQGIQQNEHVE